MYLVFSFSSEVVCVVESESMRKVVKKVKTNCSFKIIYKTAVFSNDKCHINLYLGSLQGKEVLLNPTSWCCA